MFLLTHKLLVEKLKSALAAGVEVKLIVDLPQARGKGNSSIEDLIQAGVPQHRNLPLEGCDFRRPDSHPRLSKLDEEWTTGAQLRVHVLSGTIVTLFEQEFDRMWTTATQDHPSSKRLKTALTREGTEPLPEEESSHSPGDTPVPGKKRKKRKRTLFPTTLALLGGH
ncbi:hypothetical protein PR003_g29852 [Phytophthora rubi]|nr:hypothetical protein PR002_g28674 [Phytophthora rubi]KAE9273614.1 hypothetical protein PR003_g29852 [Phytophthora rubi]